MSFMATATATLPDELVRCAWPQWSVNGHNLDTALALVQREHHDHEMRVLAREARRLAKTMPLVRAAYTSVFWQYERDAR